MTQQELLTSLSTVSEAIPIIGNMVSTIIGLYQTAHPGATDAQAIAAFATASGDAVLKADAILVADGYVLQADGVTWAKPPVAS